VIVLGQCFGMGDDAVKGGVAYGVEWFFLLICSHPRFLNDDNVYVLFGQV
jgi:hypothetical protein